MLQVKDVLFHLYKTAVGNLQRLMPKEIRIVKYLLTIEDPEEQLSALNDAFTPGDELEGKDMDCLYTYVDDPMLFLICVFCVIFCSTTELSGRRLKAFSETSNMSFLLIFIQDTRKASHMDKNSGRCLPFESRRHSYEGGSGSDGPEDHKKARGNQEGSRKQVHVRASAIHILLSYSKNQHCSHSMMETKLANVETHSKMIDEISVILSRLASACLLQLSET